MVEVCIRGGLGNQMFEYAAARNCQIRVGGELKLNLSSYARDKFGRKYSLSYFNIPDDFLYSTKNRIIPKILDGISRFFPNFSRNIGLLFNCLVWNGKKYYDISSLQKRNLCMYGYFQSEKYFEENSSVIKEELKVNEKYCTKSKQLEVVKKSNSVCVHIRRGDYVDANLVVCTLDYYKNGILMLNDKVENAEFFVFSDDINWVKENLNCFDDKININYVDDIEVDYEELQLMYNCKHFIISNSSFSWWAQYLSDYEKKIVIAPCIWMPNDKEKRAIYMDNWILLDAEGEERVVG